MTPNSAAVKDSICEAIRRRLRIQFDYNNKPRKAEPQCCGMSSKGNVIVRAYLLEGGSRPEQLFDVEKISNLQLLEENFYSPGPNFKRNDSAMIKIFCQL
jgi:hypothetical protein